MELKDYVRILNRRKWAVVLTTIATLATVAAGSLLIAPTYSATSTLRVAVISVDPIQYADFEYSDRLLNTIAALATGAPTLTELARQLELAQPPPVTAEIVAHTELLKLTVEAHDPVLAQNAATTLGTILTKSAKQLYAGAGESSEKILSQQLAASQQELNQAQQQYSTLVSAEDMAAARRMIDIKEQMYTTLLADYQKAQTEAMLRDNAISVVEPAVLPLKPSKPRLALNLALGLIAGLVAGVGLAFLSEHLDTGLYTDEQVEAVVKSRCLATIPLARRRQRLTLYENNSPQGESFRCLRMMLFDHQPELRTLLVTSAKADEGRTTVAANLACAIALTGKKVVVVDSDLRSPALHTIFDLSNLKGLSNVLKPELSLDQTIQETQVPGVHVLTTVLCRSTHCPCWTANHSRRWLGSCPDGSTLFCWTGPPFCQD